MGVPNSEKAPMRVARFAAAVGLLEKALSPPVGGLKMGPVDGVGRGAEEARGALEAFNPQGRLIQAEEVAHLVESLISGEALGINGQAFALDGGQVMR